MARQFLKKSTWGIIIVITTIIFVQSCVKDNFKLDKLTKTEWNPNLAAPLIYTSLTFNDLLAKAKKDSLIHIGTDNFITLIFEKEFLSLKASDVVIFPNQTFSSDYSLSAMDSIALSILPVGNTYTVTGNDTLNFSPGNGMLIDSIEFKSGNWNVDLSSNFKHDIQLKIDIPKTKLNGVSFSKTIALNYTNSIPVTANANYDLSGYLIDMSSGGGNKLEVYYTILVTNSGAPTSTSEKITINSTFSTLAFKSIFGYLGQQSLSFGKDTLSLDLFKSSIGTGSFMLADPKIKVIINNSYGFPINASLSQFDAYNASSGTIPITGVPNPLPIQSPTMSQIGQSLTDSFSLNNANSNIVTILNSRPSYIIYDVASQSNPAGNVGKNFVLDTSKFKLNMEFELPLYGSASNFVIQDTVNFKIDKIDQVESLLLRAFITNGFPIDLGVQVYFTDSLYNIKDSLVSPYQVIMPSAIVDGSTGKVTSSTSKTTDFAFSKTKMNNLTNVTKALFVARIATYNDGSVPPINVKFYSNYRLDIKLGVQAQLKVKL